MPNHCLSVLYKHIIQVENKNVGLKVGGGGGGGHKHTIAPNQKSGGGGGTCPRCPPPPASYASDIPYVFSSFYYPNNCYTSDIYNLLIFGVGA